VLRSLSSLVAALPTALALAILVAPSTALAASTVVVVKGPEGSARVEAIARELRARGLEVRSTDAEGAAVVRVSAEGEVVVLTVGAASTRAETFPGDEADAIVARRVAEALRSPEDVAPAPSPPSAPPLAPAPVLEPPAPPRPAPRVAQAPITPSRAFAHGGTWLLSIDNALPLLDYGTGGMVARSSVTDVGEVGHGLRATPKAAAVDVAVVNHLTVGGTVAFQGTSEGAIGTVGLRVGAVAPLASRLAIWFRAGVFYSLVGGEIHDLGAVSSLGGTVDMPLVWTVSRSVALTVGPSLTLLSSLSGPQTYLSDGADSAYLDPMPTISIGSSVSGRLGASIGITGKLVDPLEATDDDDGAEPRYFLSVERIAPLFRVHADTSADRVTLDADTGTVDVSRPVPQTPRVAFDARVAGHVTLGAAGSVGSRNGSNTLTPDSVSWSLSPRVGYHVPLTRRVAIWPRLGVTYAAITEGLYDSATHHLGADLEAFAIFSPVPGFGITLGPSVEVPLVGTRDALVRSPVDVGAFSVFTTERRDSTIFTAALTAGVVMLLP